MLRVSLLAESPGGTLELMAIITHIAIQLLTSHYEDVHTQKEQFVLKCSECQYTTPECQGLWTAN